MRLRYKLMIIFGSIILLALVITIIAVVRYKVFYYIAVVDYMEFVHFVDNLEFAYLID